MLYNIFYIYVLLCFTVCEVLSNFFPLLMGVVCRNLSLSKESVNNITHFVETNMLPKSFVRYSTCV